MPNFTPEPSWVEQLGLNLVEINYVPFQIVVEKYNLDKKRVGMLAHAEYRLYDDSSFCIDILNVHLLNADDREDGHYYKDGDDRWLGNLAINATDIPDFVKHYNKVYADIDNAK